MGFFIATTSGRKGPFSDREIQRLVSAGRVPPGVRLLDDRSGETVSAGDVASGRFSPTPARPAAPARARRTGNRRSAGTRRSQAGGGRRANVMDPVGTPEFGYSRPRYRPGRKPLTQRTGLMVTLICCLIIGGCSLHFFLKSVPITFGDVSFRKPDGWTAAVDPSRGAELRQREEDGSGAMLLVRAPGVGTTLSKDEMIAALSASAKKYPDFTPLRTVITSHRDAPAVRIRCSIVKEGVPITGMMIGIFRPASTLFVFCFALRDEFPAVHPTFVRVVDSIHFAAE